MLDATLAHYADLLEAATGTEVRDVPGAGAAGGTTAGLLAIADHFRSLEVRPGVEVVMELTGFDARARGRRPRADRRGPHRAQTAFGKTALGVARRAHAAGVRLHLLRWRREPEGIAALAPLGAVVVPVIGAYRMTLAEAMTAGPAPVVRAAEACARLLSLGLDDDLNPEPRRDDTIGPSPSAEPPGKPSASRRPQARASPIRPGLDRGLGPLPAGPGDDIARRRCARCTARAPSGSASTIRRAS